ncbi:hypothetical protein L1049_005414 [Liquidambar formosana]|uniref:Uncharacterized protein n=1 Tax=Liquidambar formosana TaxID=63359 RepID=A0AAP0RQQ3_LIQFO
MALICYSETLGYPTIIKAKGLKISIKFLIIDDAVDAKNESVALELKFGKETIEFKEVKRIDHILASLQRKLQAVPPPPPPLLEGYIPPTTEAEKGHETQQAA